MATITLTEETATSRNAIPERYLTGLDPEWRKMWTEHGKDVLGAHLITIEEFQRFPLKYSFTYLTWSGPEVHKVHDIQIPVSDLEGFITCRVYMLSGTGPFPVHLNFHGGGWVLGGLASEAVWCRSMCNELLIAVVDVDYWLALKYPFPTALYDCWAALQLMIVPTTDMQYVPLSIMNAEPLTPETCQYLSAISLADLPWSLLARESWFLNYYIRTDAATREKILLDWRMTPVLAPSFRNLAPAHIVTAEFDVERDEVECYAELLQVGGNKVTMKRYLGVPHAFAHYNHPERGLNKSYEFLRDSAELLRRVHWGMGQ
ncbi:Alpha/Beta hydrolase protein [Aspergillus germanicus]